MLKTKVLINFLYKEKKLQNIIKVIIPPFRKRGDFYGAFVLKKGYVLYNSEYQLNTTALLSHKAY